MNCNDFSVLGDKTPLKFRFFFGFSVKSKRNKIKTLCINSFPKSDWDLMAQVYF